jgi:hypothetical protein
LAVGGVQLAHVARHALFDLLLATLDLALREVVVATVPSSSSEPPLVCDCETRRRVPHGFLELRGRDCNPK